MIRFAGEIGYVQIWGHRSVSGGMGMPPHQKLGTHPADSLSWRSATPHVTIHSTGMSAFYLGRCVGDPFSRLMLTSLFALNPDLIIRSDCRDGLYHLLPGVAKGKSINQVVRHIACSNLFIGVSVLATHSDNV